MLEGVRGEDSIAELCRRGIAASMYYGWSKEFLDAGQTPAGRGHGTAATSDEVKELRRGGAQEGGVADLTLETACSKKKHAGGMGRRHEISPASEKAEIIRWSSNRTAGARTLDKLGIHPRHSIAGTIAIAPAGSGRSKIVLAGRSRLEPDPRRSGPRSSNWRCAKPNSVPRIGGALHRPEELLRLGSFGVSAAEGA